MDIVISTDTKKIFKQFLHILNPILSTRKLTKIEIEVLSQILTIDYRYKQYSREQRDKIIFNRRTKELIRQSLNNLSIASYNNVITGLRKKQLITKKKLLISVPIINNEVNINYKLKIQ